MSTQKNEIRNIDPVKAAAKSLNGYAAFSGRIALIYAQATSGQIIPVFVYMLKKYLIDQFSFFY